jgi:hypothetical protein
MIKTLGKYYIQAEHGTKSFYSVKKLRYGYCTYNIYTDEIFNVFPNKIRAMYAAAKLNNKNVSKYFHFGDVF